MAKKYETKHATVETHKGTPFDDVYRTLLDKCCQLIIPVINEVFGTDYSMDEEVLFLSNEHYSVSEDGTTIKRITDSCIKIRKRLYHLECESRSTSGIEIRMVEYDFHIALSHKYKEGEQYVLRFPESAVMYIRNNRNTPNELTVTLIMPNGTKVPYKIPTVKVQEYSKEDIFEKKLYFFIPFYILKFENQLQKINDSPELLDAFVDDYQDIYERLRKLEANNVIDYSYLCDLVDLTVKLMNIVADNKSNIQKEVFPMGGEVLELSSDIWKAEGITKGQKMNMISLIVKKIQKNKSLDTIADDLEEEVTNIKDIYDIALKHGPDYDIDAIYNELNK